MWALILEGLAIGGFQAVQADYLVKLRQYAVQVADDVVAAVGDMAGTGHS